MTEIEKKALALVNEVNRLSCCHMGEVGSVQAVKALLRAIEQHEAYRQEVSDVVERVFDECGEHIPIAFTPQLLSLIIPKPKPDLLEGVLTDAGYAVFPDDLVKVREALAKRGLEVRKIGEGE